MPSSGASAGAAAEPKPSSGPSASAAAEPGASSGPSASAAAPQNESRSKRGWGKDEPRAVESKKLRALWQQVENSVNPPEVDRAVIADCCWLIDMLGHFNNNNSTSTVGQP